MRKALAAIGLSTFSTLGLWPATSAAAVVYTSLSTPLTTVANPGGGLNDGTGVWFNPLTGYAEARGFLFPSTLFEDGKFFLLWDAFNYKPAEAEIFVQGLFSRGNGVVYASSSNLNPAWFGAGAAIGASTGYQSPGAGFPDIGPNFGNGTPGRGFLGLTIRDPSGASSSDVFYGFADITLAADYAITLNAFAYNDQRGQAITTSFSSPVPEPATAWLLGLGALGMVGAAQAGRRRGASPVA